ncbi:unnamed protein product, partial [Ectocarpus sp. 12 AP-2014]
VLSELLRAFRGELKGLELAGRGSEKALLWSSPPGRVVVVRRQERRRWSSSSSSRVGVVVVVVGGGGIVLFGRRCLGAVPAASGPVVVVLDLGLELCLELLLCCRCYVEQRRGRRLSLSAALVRRRRGPSAVAVADDAGVGGAEGDIGKGCSEDRTGSPPGEAVADLF